MTARLTQKERVLRALQGTHGRGVTRVDFLRPVIDGGAPILNIPARIEELRKEGHTIHNAGRRDDCVVYVLAPPAEPWQPVQTTEEPQDGATVTSLFDPAIARPAPVSPYDTGGEAA